jgi:Zn-dependent protease/CBS domain-containing protein
MGNGELKTADWRSEIGARAATGSNPNHPSSTPNNDPGRSRPGRAAARGVFSRSAIPLGRILGIRIGVDYSWFIIFVLLTWSLAVVYFPAEFDGWPPALYWAMGAVTAVMLFVSVLLHELGHSVIAQRYGIPVRSITLFIFGGVAQIGAEPPRPKAELLIAIGGPVVSLALAALFFLAARALVPLHPLFGMARYLALINASLVAFNLIPGFPLDGGRVLRAIVWAINRNLPRATIIAATVGRVFAYVFIALGLWQIFAGNFGGGLWIAFIGWFLETAAVAQVRQVSLQRTLAGHTVAEAMSTSCPVVPATLTARQLIDEYVLPTGRWCFVVRQGDAVVGLLPLRRLKKLPRAAWETTTVADAMLPMDRLRPIRPDVELWNALQQMDRDGQTQVPVFDDGTLVGVLSRDDVLTRLRVLHELGALASR